MIEPHRLGGLATYARDMENPATDPVIIDRSAKVHQSQV